MLFLGGRRCGGGSRLICVGSGDPKGGRGRNRRRRGGRGGWRAFLLVVVGEMFWGEKKVRVRYLKVQGKLSRGIYVPMNRNSYDSIPGLKFIDCVFVLREYIPSSCIAMLAVKFYHDAVPMWYLNF